MILIKKNKSLRLYINNKNLNKILIKNYYILLFINILLNRLYKAKYIPKINIYNTYYIIKVNKKDY